MVTCTLELRPELEVEPVVILPVSSSTISYYRLKGGPKSANSCWLLSERDPRETFNPPSRSRKEEILWAREGRTQLLYSNTQELTMAQGRQQHSILRGKAFPMTKWVVVLRKWDEFVFFLSCYYLAWDINMITRSGFWSRKRKLRPFG